MTPRQDLAWWQRLLMALKLWRPTYRTLHDEMREMERPALPPVTGAYGNRVDLTARRRLVPQSGDADTSA